MSEIDVVKRAKGWLTGAAWNAGEAAEVIEALVVEVERLREDLHLANGVAGLAMKHRDIAEAEVARLGGECAMYVFEKMEGERAVFVRQDDGQP